MYKSFKSQTDAQAFFNSGGQIDNKPNEKTKKSKVPQKLNSEVEEETELILSSATFVDTDKIAPSIQTSSSTTAAATTTTTTTTTNITNTSIFDINPLNKKRKLDALKQPSQQQMRTFSSTTTTNSTTNSTTTPLIVFTDGNAKGNGYKNSKAGCGV